MKALKISSDSIFGAQSKNKVEQWSIVSRPTVFNDKGQESPKGNATLETVMFCIAQLGFLPDGKQSQEVREKIKEALDTNPWILTGGKDGKGYLGGVMYNSEKKTYITVDEAFVTVHLYNYKGELPDAPATLQEVEDDDNPV